MKQLQISGYWLQCFYLLIVRSGVFEGGFELRPDFLGNRCIKDIWMAEAVRLQRFGETMDSGVIVDCKIALGDEVEKGDVIFEIETDKVTLEIESTGSGFVKAVLAKPEQSVSVGDALVLLGKKDEEVAQDFIDSLKAEAGKEELKSQTSQSVQSGKGMAEITRADLKESSGDESDVGEIRPGGKVRLTKMQQLTAERMLESKRQIPCFYLNVEVDVTELVAVRKRLNEKREAKISYNDFLIKAAAMGIEKIPIMSGQVEDEFIRLADSINVGLAVSGPRGLVVPVVKDVPKKTIEQIAKQADELIEKAKEGKLELTDIEGACITISNLGGFGVDSFIPIVIPGQCSIVGVGHIREVFEAEREEESHRKKMTINLSVDHKVANGSQASQFLDFVRRFLEEPETLLQS